MITFCGIKPGENDMFALPGSVTKKNILFSSFAKIAGAPKKTTIEICKVRLPVLINPASSFSHRSAVRFPPENL